MSGKMRQETFAKELRSGGETQAGMTHGEDFPPPPHTQDAITFLRVTILRSLFLAFSVLSTAFYAVRF